MLRRSFLKTLLAAVAAPLLPKVAVAEKVTKPLPFAGFKPGKHTLKLLQSGSSSTPGVILAEKAYGHQNIVLSIDSNGRLSNPESIMFPVYHEDEHFTVDSVQIQEDNGESRLIPLTRKMTLSRGVQPVFSPETLTIEETAN
jgi:hypothetical protein